MTALMFHERTSASQTPKSLVAVAVPLSNRMSFTASEETSLRHLNHHLGGFDRYFIIPEGCDIQVEGFKIKRFSSDFFGSVDAHRKLLFSEAFYLSFAAYTYLLIYHLDALVFSNQLVRWCSKGFDYIAAPWVKHPDAPYFGDPGYEGKVGNGGFSLRRIESFLSVIKSKRLWRNPLRRALHELFHGTTHERYASFVNFFRYWNPQNNGVRQEMECYYHNEDHFWPNRAAHYVPGFRVAPVSVAIQFAFECVPRHSFELNGRQLPFGCHAWERYDRDFWTPYLLERNIG